jgi:outer membrane protein assembly factor BamB
MKKSTITFLTFSTFLISAAASAQSAFIGPKLEKIWTSSEGLTVPESSCYNSADKTVYVSNIVGMHNIKDGIGYISKLDDKGQFIVKEWVKGLNAPKGIACSKKKLYVTDIDRLVEINLKNGKIEKTYQNRKSKSLNDVTVASNGQIYVSDSGGNCIFMMGKDSLEVFLESDQLSAMNGILSIENLLYLGSKGNFISIDRTTKAIKVLAENAGYLDGIVMVSNNKFITSDFRGKVQFIEPGKPIETLLNTTELKINAADLGYIPSQNLLLVPTFNDNKVGAYKVKL